MTEQTKLSNCTHEQRTRLLAALEAAKGRGVTSYAANQQLGIYHPPARIKELRDTGHNIATLWDTIETDISRPRRVARYVLISKGGN